MKKIQPSLLLTAVSVDNISTLTYTITNANTVGLTGLNFTDNYPVGVINTTPIAVGGDCGSITHTATAGGTSCNLTGATIGALSTCKVTVDVTASTVGAKNNAAENIGSTETGSGTDDASATLNVFLPTIYYVELLSFCGGKIPCFANIQDAIDEAFAFNGIMIRVAEGNYLENITNDAGALIEIGWDPDFTSQNPSAAVVLTGP